MAPWGKGSGKSSANSRAKQGKYMCWYCKAPDQKSWAPHQAAKCGKSNFLVNDKCRECGTAPPEWVLKKQQELRGTNRHDSPAAENTEEVKALKKRAADAENRSKQLAENNAKLKEQRLKEAADQTLLEEGFQCSKAQQKKLAKQAKKEAQRSESEELPIDAPMTPLDEEVDEPAVSLLVKVDISRIMKKASLPKAGKAKGAVTPEELAKSALAKLGDNTSAVLQDRSQQEQELAQWKKAIPSLSAGPVLDEINGKVKVLEQELAKSPEKLTTPKQKANLEKAAVNLQQQAEELEQLDAKHHQRRESDLEEYLKEISKRKCS